MNDVLVSVRMPEPLYIELKELAKEEFYMDVSEEVRSIIRKKWMMSMHPELIEISKLKKDILSEMKKRTENEITKKIIQELNEIKKKVEEDNRK